MSKYRVQPLKDDVSKLKRVPSNSSYFTLFDSSIKQTERQERRKENPTGTRTEAKANSKD